MVSAFKSTVVLKTVSLSELCLAAASRKEAGKGGGGTRAREEWS